MNISTSVWLTLAVAAVSAALAALLGEAVALGVRRLGRKREILATLAQRGRRPLAGFLATLAARTSLGVYTRAADWRDPTFSVLNLLTVAFAAWLAVVAVNVVQDVALLRYRIDVADNRRARQRRTQVTLVRRVVVALIVVVAVASVLLTIPGARGVGTSVLASAGLLSVVAGLAAQTSLANIFAGLQIAFTDAIRVDDVVVVEEEWGNIEDITLTYVVVRLWDQRRLILPSTYFTTTPFANWTRNSSDIVGAVELDVDWNVPVERLRSHAEAFVKDHPLWNGQTYVLQVTEARNSFVTLRVLVSADSGGELFDLRCAVREELVGFLRREHPDALPRVRVATPPPVHLPQQHDGRRSPHGV
ncbi:small-conductance mechanosensitive channel [Kineococcus radiotolerans]|uniref:Small-conductance mechanosensitive channel n=1 Tax=Kineococcus radiotolerans TaxID=131568 RepID=A0A7W4XVK4_KINRA|nr:mechanosensitive ion channel domain-containing protein [Kineococcus radiotolerans]MBB2900121.1 small-conductance mechanosensitive channel [Kineococcus radiotolerans]